MSMEPFPVEVQPRMTNTRQQNTALAVRQLLNGGFTADQLDEFLDVLHRLNADDTIIAPLTRALFTVNVRVQWVM